MNGRFTAAAAVVLIAAGVTLLYAHRLADVPAYLNLDEAHFGNHAYSLARTGRDLNGNVLPLFISLEDPLGDRPVLAWGTTWYHPVGFYLIAAVLAVATPSEESIRLPIALIGVVNVLLIFLVGRRWYGDWRAGLTAAGLLALMPAHFILSRIALDYLLPVPFVLAWLLVLSTLLRDPSPRAAVLAGLILGAGCFSYVSSWLLMPAYLAITAIALWRGVHRRDLVAPLCAGFLAPLSVLVLWVAWHPSMPFNLLAQYQAGESRQSILTAIATRGDVLGAVRAALSAYWSYFNPSFLFVSGGPSRLVSTGAIGVWALGMLPLLAMAVFNLWRTPLTMRDRIVITGLLLAPLPAALKGEPFAIQRAVTLLPFSALFAAGAARGGTGLSVVAMTITLIAVPWQFANFAGDYFGAYRQRSAITIDPTSFRETAGVILAASPPAIALTAPLYDVSAKWRFYCVRQGRTDLLERTRYFSGALAEVSQMPAGTLAVVEAATREMPAGWSRVEVPADVAGNRPLAILRRD